MREAYNPAGAVADFAVEDDRRKNLSRWVKAVEGAIDLHRGHGPELGRDSAGFRAQFLQTAWFLYETLGEVPARTAVAEQTGICNPCQAGQHRMCSVTFEGATGPAVVCKCTEGTCPD